eukprot:scaffold416_cov329-Pavlova_lutheri.AAC.29
MAVVVLFTCLGHGEMERCLPPPKPTTGPRVVRIGPGERGWERRRIGRETFAQNPGLQNASIQPTGSTGFPPRHRHVARGRRITHADGLQEQLETGMAHT